MHERLLTHLTCLPRLPLTMERQHSLVATQMVAYDGLVMLIWLRRAGLLLLLLHKDEQPLHLARYNNRFGRKTPTLGWRLRKTRCL